MAHADWIIDLGPGAGHDGGRVVSEGTPADLLATRATLTGQHLADYVVRLNRLRLNRIWPPWRRDGPKTSDARPACGRHRPKRRVLGSRYAKTGLCCPWESPSE